MTPVLSGWKLTSRLQVASGLSGIPVQFSSRRWKLPIAPPAIDRDEGAAGVVAAIDDLDRPRDAGRANRGSAEAGRVGDGADARATSFATQLGGEAGAAFGAGAQLGLEDGRIVGVEVDLHRAGFVRIQVLAEAVALTDPEGTGAGAGDFQGVDRGHAFAVVAQLQVSLAGIGVDLLQAEVIAARLKGELWRRRTPFSFGGRRSAGGGKDKHRRAER